MSGFTYKNHQLYAENVALQKIAEEVGTPVYCYSSKVLLENYSALEDALLRVMPDHNFLIAYACKSNSNIAVMKTLADAGAGMDIVSGGELKRALAAGTAPDKIVFSGVGKTVDELTAAIEHNIWQINVESVPELEMLSKIASELGKTARIAIRVNPDVDAETHEKISTGRKEDKFGIDIDVSAEIYDRAAELPGLEVLGAAMHIGSQIAKTEPFRKAFVRMVDLIADLRERGHDIQRIDVGGGFGITYKDEAPINLDNFAALLKEVIAPLGCQIILEPGRAFSGNAGVLLSEVLFIKDGATRKFMVTDAAMNDLIRPTLYSAYHPLWPVEKRDGKTAAYDVVGPVCETGDTFMVNEELPEVQQGDLMAFMVSGAYGAAMSSYYNTRPLIPEVLVKGDDYAVIRKRPTVEEILEREDLPHWMA